MRDDAVLRRALPLGRGLGHLSLSASAQNIRDIRDDVTYKSMHYVTLVTLMLPES